MKYSFIKRETICFRNRNGEVLLTDYKGDRGCASSAFVKQLGESPSPAKPQRAAGTQPWSLGREAGFKRR